MTVAELCTVTQANMSQDFVDRLKAAAKRDPEYQRLMKDPRDTYKVIGSLLFKSVEGQLRLVVPNTKDLKTHLLRECHDIPVAGHLGRDKTYYSLTWWFYWPGMYTDATQYVACCPECQVNKASTQAPVGLAQPMPIPDAPWQQLTLDLVSLPKSRAGYDTAVVFVDKFSKMTHIAPTVQECTGADVAQLYMEHVFKHHGLVESIVSDRDPRFTGAVWSSIHKLMGTTLKMSTAAHPQTDGQSERAVRTVTEMLHSYAGHD